jgi:hypothetical protein
VIEQSVRGYAELWALFETSDDSEQHCHDLIKTIFRAKAQRRKERMDKRICLGCSILPG